MFSSRAGRLARFFVAAGCFALASAFFVSGQTAQVPPAPMGVASTASSASNFAPPATHTFYVTAREVLVNAVVVDEDGQPVTGLNASDFRVTEEGKAQTIRWVHEHHPMDAAAMSRIASTPELPPNTFSNFTRVQNTNAPIVLLLDDMDTPVADQMVVHQQLIDFFKHMQRGPSIAIFQLDTEVRLIQEFTSDPKVLLAALESQRTGSSLAQPTAARRRYTYNAVYRRTLMENLHSGMRMMGRYLGGYPGRKSLIWFTGRVPMTIWGEYGFGIPFSDRMTVSENEDETHELTDVLALSNVAVYPVDTLASRNFDNGKEFSYYGNERNMDLIAAQTGGKAYYGNNNFTRAIEDAIRTGSSYYTISYVTSNTLWKGEFRQIAVAVNRPKVKVLCKSGYYAFSLANREQHEIASIEKRNAQTGNQRNGKLGRQASGPNVAAETMDAELGVTIHPSAKGGFDEAMGLGAIAPTEIVFTAHLEPAAKIVMIGKHENMPPGNFLLPEWQHKPFRTYTIAFDADVRRVRFTQLMDGMRHASIKFVAVVYTRDGQPVNSMARTWATNLTREQIEKMLGSGLHAQLHIAIPTKGHFFLRLGIHDLEGDQVGALEIPVDQIQLESAHLRN